LTERHKEYYVDCEIEMDDATASLKARFIWAYQGARFTNFYPRYNGANDQVDPVLPVQPLSFQRIIPKYRLSTSETRDQGTGPMFDDGRGVRPSEGRKAAVRGTATTRKPAADHDMGRIVDLLA
jgi:hypothetical protein